MTAMNLNTNVRELFFQNIVDEAPFPVANIMFIFDDFGTACDCKLIDMNYAFSEEFGLSRDNATYKRASELFDCFSKDNYDWDKTYKFIIAFARSGREETLYSDFFKNRITIKVLQLRNNDFIIYLSSHNSNMTETISPLPTDTPTIRKIPAWSSNEDILLDPSDVYYLSINKGDVKVHTKDGTYYLKGTLKQWENKLMPMHFFRCHKCFLINITKISRIVLCVDKTYKIKMKNVSDEIPLSRNKTQDLKEILFI